MARHDLLFGDYTRLEHPITTIEDIRQAFATTSLEEVTGLPTIAAKMGFLRDKIFKMVKVIEQTPVADLPPELRREWSPSTNFENTIKVLQELSGLSQKPPASWWRNQLNHYSVWGSALSTEELPIIKEIFNHRCEEGYLFDCKKNSTILADDPWLQDVWDWVAGLSIISLLKT